MTQCERVLRVLADGAPHTHHEFYGFCVLHSRISDLRKRGYAIECWREGDDYLYQLNSGTEPDGQPPQKVAPPEQHMPVDVVAPLWPASSVPVQLRLVA